MTVKRLPLQSSEKTLTSDKEHPGGNGRHPPRLPGKRPEADTWGAGCAGMSVGATPGGPLFPPEEALCPKLHEAFNCEEDSCNFG